MYLSSPLASLVPALHARVIQVLLSNTGGVTGRQVHRLAGMGSDTGVRNILVALVEQGLVLSETVGRARLYRMNTDHVLYRSLLDMSRVRAEIVSRVRVEIESWDNGVPAWHSSIFGSFARGEAGPDSDIDVLVVIAPDAGTDLTDDRWVTQIATLAQNIETWTGNVGQILDADVTTLGKMLQHEDPLVASWRADAVPLSGETLLQMLREVRVRCGMPLQSLGGAR
ncbi:MAG: hypothetical protein QG608_2313 [Actinomycetota bacterium]|nr:hypothetical protein [Actinomycetota bacterium]